MNDLQKTDGGMDLAPQNFREAYQMAEMVAQSDFCPKNFRGKKGDIFLAFQMGNELGLKPLMALQNIAVINGRPSIYGDALLGLIQGRDDCEYIEETLNEESMTATCKVKRKGKPEHVSTFSKVDAQTAGLWGKDIWKSYPKRMLQHRARGFALRNTFADALTGLVTQEEARDTNPEPKMADVTAVDGQPVKKSSDEDKQRFDELSGSIGSCDNEDCIKDIMKKAEDLPDIYKVQLTEQYRKKRMEIKKGKANKKEEIKEVESEPVVISEGDKIETGDMNMEGAPDFLQDN